MLQIIINLQIKILTCNRWLMGGTCLPKSLLLPPPYFYYLLRSNFYPQSVISSDNNGNNLIFGTNIAISDVTLSIIVY